MSMTERAMTEGELRTIKVPDLIQGYAQTYYEWGIRNGCFRVFSHRQKFDPMTNDEVGKELDRLKTEIIEQYGDGLAVLRPHLGLGVTPDQRVMMTTALDGIERAVTEFEGAELRRWVAEYVSVLRAIAGRGEVEGQ